MDAVGRSPSRTGLRCCLLRRASGPGGAAIASLPEPMLAPRRPSRRRALNRSLERLIRVTRTVPVGAITATKCPRGCFRRAAGLKGGGKFRLADRIAVAVVWILHFLPLALLAPIGSARVRCCTSLDAKRRNVCLINLSRCFPEIDRKGASRPCQSATSAPFAGASSNARFLVGTARTRDAARENCGTRADPPRSRDSRSSSAPHFVGLDGGLHPRDLRIDMAGKSTRDRRTLSSTPCSFLGRTRFGASARFPAGRRAAGARALKRGFRFYYLRSGLRASRRDFVPFFAASAATITGLSP